MCGDCYKVIKENKALFDEYRNNQYFNFGREPESHCYYKGERICKKWWEESVGAPVP